MEATFVGKEERLTQKQPELVQPLFRPGCLGTCWYGRYHYMEPWVGCSHDCAYCYVRSEKEVLETFKRGRGFDQPKLLVERALLPAQIRSEIKKHSIEIVKLSRFTDIFSSPFVENGLSLEILSELCQSCVRRIIITTKGLPPQETFSLFARYREKISYNAALRPPLSWKKWPTIEPAAPTVEQRLEAAARINKLGVQTTVHVDPIICGIDDDPAMIQDLVRQLKKAGLNRVMFSHLLLDKNIVKSFRKRLPAQVCETIFSQYDLEHLCQILPDQPRTAMYFPKKKVHEQSARRFIQAFTAHGLEFVYCSLKNKNGRLLQKLSGDCQICNGGFYA